MPCPCIECHGVFDIPIEDVVYHLEHNGCNAPPPLDPLDLPPRDIPGPIGEPVRVLSHPHLNAVVESDSASESEAESESDTEETIEQKCQLICRQIVDEIAGGLAQTVAVRVLNIVKHHLTGVLSDDVQAQLPSTIYSLKKKAGVIHVKSFVRHFCPYGCRMFQGPTGPQEACGLCDYGYRLDDQGRPTCENLYFSLDDWCERMYAVAEVAEALDMWADRAQSKHTPGTYRDSADGSILRDFFTRLGNAMNCTLPFELCCDGIVLYTASARTMTPVVFHCHALPPHMRTTLGCTFFAAALCTESKPDQITLLPIISQFAARAPVAGTPHALTDAHGRRKLVHYIICWLLNDLRGHAGPIQSKSSPAYKGVCSICDVTGDGHNTHPHTHTAYSARTHYTERGHEPHTKRT